MAFVLTVFSVCFLASAQSQNPGLNCSLNGVPSTTTGACVCDTPWTGVRCETLSLAPGKVGLDGLPLAMYHGDGPNATSWGASVLFAPEDGKYYAWVASMINECTLADWQTNSEVVLAIADTPLGPFSKVKTIVPPWAHNPQAIRAPDPGSKHGHVYALFSLGLFSVYCLRSKCVTRLTLPL